MTVMDLDPTARSRRSGRLGVVICGSYHRDPVGLGDAFARLGEICDVLSPTGLDWVDPAADFVVLPDQVSRAATEIEAEHLDALRQADFVWLHAPDGYVGLSAAMEIGYARAAGVPVLTSTVLRDTTLAAMTTVVASGIEGAIQACRPNPGASLDALQHYYARTAERRGWAEESARDALLLLTEELGEVARAIRKAEGISRHMEDPSEDVALELADVLLYLVHLSNILQIDLATAVARKEAINSERHDASRSAA